MIEVKKKHPEPPPRPVAGICPNCKKTTVRYHCPKNKWCRWFTCPDKDCHTTFGERGHFR